MVGTASFVIFAVGMVWISLENSAHINKTHYLMDSVFSGGFRMLMASSGMTWLIETGATCATSC